MDAYSGFAAVYDMFMDNIPYDEWCAYLRGCLEERGIRDGLVLDLGCGTGSVTERLAAMGYDMIGVDASEEMLQAAMEKRERSGADILYLQQDMREFELYGTVRAVVSVCDSMNYILDYADLTGVFKLVSNYLDPGGVFIFDMNTEYKYRELLGSGTIAEEREEGSFIWENEYDEEERINEYDLTFFVREEGELYRRYQETHFQRAYSPEEVARALGEAGLWLEAVCDAFTGGAPGAKSERICFIAREREKEKKRKQSGNIEEERHDG